MRALRAILLAGALVVTSASGVLADENGNPGDCQSGGCGNEHHHNGDNIHFERIGPVYICVEPGSCTQPKKGTPE